MFFVKIIMLVGGIMLIAFGFHYLLLEYTGLQGLTHIILPGIGGAALVGFSILLFKTQGSARKE